MKSKIVLIFGIRKSLNFCNTPWEKKAWGIRYSQEILKANVSESNPNQGSCENKVPNEFV